MCFPPELPTVYGFKTRPPSRCCSSVVWFFFFQFALNFLSFFSCCNPIPLIWWRGWIVTAVTATKTSRRCSRTLLILAEIQKTDLAWQGVDFVEIKGSLPSPASLYQLDPRRHVLLEHELWRWMAHSILQSHALIVLVCRRSESGSTWIQRITGSWSKINWLFHC